MELGAIYIIILIVAFVFLLGYMEERRARKAYAKKLLNEYGKKNSRNFGGNKPSDFAGFLNAHEKEFHIDDITFNDLDMWSVYKQLNYAKSSAGDEYLYYMLRTPEVRKKDYEDFEKKVNYFIKNEKDRQNLQLLYHDIGRTGKYSVYDYLLGLENMDDLNVSLDITMDVLLIVAFVMSAMGYFIGILLLIGILIFNFITYFKKKSSMDAFMICFEYSFRILRNSKMIAGTKISVLEEEIERIKEASKGFANFKRFSSIVMDKSSGSPMAILMDYFRMLTHLDIIKFKSMSKDMVKNKDNLDKLIEVMGEIDAIIAIGEYRVYLKDYCIPEFNKESKKYTVKNLYHPLIENAVKNDIDIDKSVLLTGSNASGKSTFLKTVALNTILAQSIHMVCADSYSADLFKVISSLSLKDNILTGESYYMVEIKAIKRIMDEYKNSDVPVLGFVDEVLRGTNTTERIAASSVVLSKLNNGNGLVFAATHDLELTQILSGEYENYHFEEEMRDDDIYFPYKIYKGKAISRNAIKMLGIMGYEKEIVEKAANKALDFEKTGNWY